MRKSAARHSRRSVYDVPHLIKSKIALFLECSPYTSSFSNAPYLSDCCEILRGNIAHEALVNQDHVYQ